MSADITLRGPADLVAVLPYQLGYHPRHSVVVVALRGRQVGLVMRSDLPPDDDHADETAFMLLGPLLREGASSVCVVGYEDEVDASQAVLVRLVDRLEGSGITVVDVAVVRDGRRYSPVCSDPCCPPEGVPLAAPADVPGVAEFVALGRCPLSSRDAVLDLVEPEPVRCAGVPDAVEARARVPRPRRRSAAAWGRLLQQPGGSGSAPRGSLAATLLAPDAVADLVLGLRDVAWRDGLIAWLAPGLLPADDLDAPVVALLRSSLPTWGGMGLDGPGSRRGGRGSRATGRLGQRVAVEREELLQRLLAVCRSVPDDVPGEAAAVCTVAAHVAWAAGDGAIARVAVERARRLQPDYRLAELLERLVDHGVRPPGHRRPRGSDTIERAG